MGHQLQLLRGCSVYFGTAKTTFLRNWSQLLSGVESELHLLGGAGRKSLCGAVLRGETFCGLLSQ